MEAKHRVAITHYREGQLREIFDGLDFDSIGVIDLEELKNAVQYAEEQLKGKRGPSFKDVGKMFEAMDEDGNGEVDYHEFMIAMTGSAKSLIDVASEQDIEKLRAKFKEYAVKKKREHCIKCIGEERPLTTATTMSGIGGHGGSGHAGASAVPSVATDVNKCKYFTTLFNIGASQNGQEDFEEHDHAANKHNGHLSIRHKIQAEHPSPKVKVAPNSPVHIERILDPFAGLDIDSIEKNSNPTKKDMFYYHLESRIREERRQAYVDLQKDSEARDVEKRVLHEKQYILDVRKPGPYDCRQKYLRQRKERALSPIRREDVKHKIGAKLAATRDAKIIRNQRTDAPPPEDGMVDTDRGLLPDLDIDAYKIESEDEYDISFDEFQSINVENIPRSFSGAVSTLPTSLIPSGVNTKPQSSSRPAMAIQALRTQRDDLLQDTAGKKLKQETIDKYVFELGSFDDDRRSVGIFTEKELKKKQKTEATRKNKQSSKTLQPVYPPPNVAHSSDNMKSVLLNCLRTPKHPLSASLSSLPASLYTPTARGNGVRSMASLAQTVN
jgi:hypothetical protein